MTSDTFATVEPRPVLGCFRSLSRVPRVPGKPRQAGDSIGHYVKNPSSPVGRQLKESKHPPLEWLFNTDEETDMGDASGLDFGNLVSRTIINLDAPAVGVCGAGELEVEMRFPREHVPVLAGSVQYSIHISGLTGGHTGRYAMPEKGNAIIYLNRLLLELRRNLPFQLLSMRGGAGMSSAFARNAECTVTVPGGHAPKLKRLVREQSALFPAELALRDPGVTGA